MQIIITEKIIGVRDMKKYVLLAIVSLTIILTVFAVGHTVVEKTDYARGYRAAGTTAVSRLHCTGTVEYADSSSAVSSGSGVVQTIFAKNGDRVLQGDVILAVCETAADIGSSDIMSSLTNGGISSLTSLFDSDASVNVYRAGKTGILSGLDIEQGGFYLKGQTLFRVSDEKSFRVQLNVSEKDIGDVKTGQHVTIDCKALPNVFYGTVSSIGDSARQTSGGTGKMNAVKVTVDIENAPDELRTGYTADCSVLTKRCENVLLLPYSAVSADDSGRSFVYRSDGTYAERTYVETGVEYSNGIEITNGLRTGDIVVYDVSKINTRNKTIIDRVEAAMP